MNGAPEAKHQYCHCGKGLPDEVSLQGDPNHPAYGTPVVCPECKEQTFALPHPLPLLTTHAMARSLMAVAWALRCQADLAKARSDLAHAEDAAKAAELTVGRFENRLWRSLGVPTARPIPMSSGDRRVRS